MMSPNNRTSMPETYWRPRGSPQIVKRYPKRAAGINVEGQHLEHVAQHRASRKAVVDMESIDRNLSVMIKQYENPEEICEGS